MGLDINSTYSALNVQKTDSIIGETTTSGTQVFADALAKAIAGSSPDPEYSSSTGAVSDMDTTMMMMLCMMMGNSSDDGEANDALSNILLQLLLARDGITYQPGAPLSSYAGQFGQQGELDYEQIVKTAMTRLGDPYSQARAGQKDYTDCSYLTRWCYRELGVELPRTAAAQAKYCADNGMTISKSELQPGDLVFFSLKKNGRYMNISHVAIYAGNGKIVDASSANGKVVYRDLFSEGQVMYARPSKAA